MILYASTVLSAADASRKAFWQFRPLLPGGLTVIRAGRCGGGLRARLARRRHR